MSTTSESDFIPLPSQASCARPKIGGKKGTNSALPISLGISISESWFLPQPRVKPNHCMYHNQNHFHGRMWDSSCISYLVAKDQGAYVCVCDCVCVCLYIYIYAFGQWLSPLAQMAARIMTIMTHVLLFQATCEESSCWRQSSSPRVWLFLL